MDKNISADYKKEYKDWIENISHRYEQSQVRAAVSVNRELVSFYWSLGKDIVEKQAENKFGSHFYEILSKDLKKKLSGVQGFAVSNLRYMKRFYELYSNRIVIRPQTVDELGNGEVEPNRSQAVGELGNGEAEPNHPQAVGDLTEEILFSVPWGHHRLIIDKCSDDLDKAIFFVKKTVQNNWSRAVLDNFLATDLYARQGKAITNFKYSLPAAQSDLAQEITRDPYNFDFLTIQEDYDEKQLKDALVDNVIKFLLELGTGFSFIGREVPLPVGDTNEKIDLLFYHTVLHCYIVVEVKVKAFNSRDIGQTATYVAIADDLIRKEGDNKTIGLIICKSKNNVLAKYAAGTSTEPIGISTYELSNLLPTTEQIEENLKDEE